MATPKSFKTRFIEPGIISYEDQNDGIVLVSKEALDNMAPSFKGCPVIFIPESHDDSDKENSFNFDDIGSNTPAGIVTSKPYWGDDGWQWVDMIIWNDEAVNAIETKDFNVSCAYNIDKTNDGGIWHELEYDNEIVDGTYLHMAIVARPRYERSKILANSKGGLKNMGLFKLAGKKKNEAAPQEPAKKDEEATLVNADDTMIDVNGVPTPLYELVEAYKMKQGAGDTPATLAPEDMVDVEGFGQVSVADLIAASTGVEEEGDDTMKNAEAPTDTTAEKPVDEGKQLSNSAPKVVQQKRVVNKALKNSVSHSSTFKSDGIESETKRLERGKSRYTIPTGGK